MLESKKKILITILLGAVGSGVWQYIIEPSFSSGINIFLNIVTLGMEEFKNNIYIEIAKGFHEESSNKILIMLTMIFCFAMFFIYILMIDIKNIYFEEDKPNNSEKENSKKDRINEIEEELKINSEKIELLKNKSIKMDNNLTRDSYAVLFSAILISAIVFANAVEVVYSNNAITHYRQLISIISPYVSHEEILTYNSDFSKIRSSKDYKKLIDNIENNIKKDNDEKAIPNFIIW